MSFKVVPSHHWEVGSTTVGGVRVNPGFRDMVITEAMGRHLRSYPYAIDLLFRGSLFEATRSMEHKDLLKRPLLDDHLSKGNSEAYPRGGVCKLCVMFQSFCLVMFVVIYAWFYFWVHTFFHAYLLTVIYLQENKPKLLQPARVHIAKKTEPDLTENK